MIRLLYDVVRMTDGRNIDSITPRNSRNRGRTPEFTLRMTAIKILHGHRKRWMGFETAKI